jgi:hypothetical protein
MQPVRQRDVDGVDVGLGEQLVVGGVEARHAERLRRRAAPGGVA